MWKPGTLLRVSHNDFYHRMTNQRMSTVVKGRCLVFVVATVSTGYGTKGEKWNAEILVEGKLLCFKNAWLHQDAFEYVVLPQ